MCKYNLVIGKVFDMYNMINEQVYQVKHLPNFLTSLSWLARGASGLWMFAPNKTSLLLLLLSIGARI